eukprot:COSAG05_NODE_4847_length_1350_cov_7.190248_1_plen_156_part_00
MTASRVKDLMALAAVLAAQISFEPMLATVPIGARLRFFAHEWHSLIGDPWCTSVVRHGYFPEMTGEFIVGCPPRSVAACMLDPVREAERNIMLAEMLKEEVIERVGSPLTLFSAEHSPGIWPVLTSIFSTYFLVPKSDGGWRGYNEILCVGLPAS